MQIVNLKENIFLFKFACEGDKKRTLELGLEILKVFLLSLNNGITMGLFGLSLFLLKLKTDTENTVAK